MANLKSVQENCNDCLCLTVTQRITEVSFKSRTMWERVVREWGEKSDIFKHVTFMSSSECQIEKERGRIHVDLMTVSSLGKEI